MMSVMLAIHFELDEAPRSTAKLAITMGFPVNVLDNSIT